MKIVILSFALILPIHLFAQQIIHFQGHALNDKEEMIYREYHELQTNDQGIATQVLTYYTKPDSKKPFAKLLSIFDQGNNSLPRTLFEDERFHTREEVLFENNGETMVIRQTDLKRDRSKESRIRVTQDMVHGQGYHNLIVSNFDTFKVGEKRELNFVVPSRMTAYRFELTALGTLRSEPDVVGFQLDIKNWLLRMFADKITVEYEKETKRLLTYIGLTNIQDDRGQSLSLTVRMNYDLNEPLKVSPVK
jgi:hypothetical protein